MTETIHVRGEGGMVIAMDLPLPEPIAERFKAGALQRVEADGSPYTGPADPEMPAPPDKVPAKGASKAEWAAWAVVCGATVEAAETATKADLIDKYADASPQPLQGGEGDDSVGKDADTE